MSLRICTAMVVLAGAMLPAAVRAEYVSRDLYTIQLPVSGTSWDRYFTMYDPIQGGPVATGGQVVSSRAIAGYYRAYLWNNNGTGVDLTPAGLLMSTINGTNTTQQVGSVNWHAAMWSGSAASYRNLDPTNLSGYTTSEAVGINATGTQQAGYGSGLATGSKDHALLWNGSANSAVDLNPSGVYDSRAYATRGGQQVGYGNYSATDGSMAHAMLWTGSAASAVDLNPTGYAHSHAMGTDGQQQVGWGRHPDMGYSMGHALLWNGTAASFVDLNPTNVANITASWAYDTNSSQQVGTGIFDVDSFFDNHAMLWNGSADSAVDLHVLLPVSFASRWSEAYSIDASGNIYGVAQDSAGSFHAIQWAVVPEPSCLALVGIAGIGMLRRRNT